MMQEPLHTIGVPSAVRRQTPSIEVDVGPGKTETEALESTRNSLLDKISHRNRREEIKLLQEQELEQGQQVGQEFPPDGLLVF